MSHHLTQLGSHVFTCVSPSAKLEARESEASSDFPASRFQLRLAHPKEAFWSVHSSSAHHVRCLGRPGSCSHCWSTLRHVVMGGNALGIPGLFRGPGTWPCSNMPSLPRWKGAEVCRQPCVLALGSRIFGCSNTVCLKWLRLAWCSWLFRESTWVFVTRCLVSASPKVRRTRFAVSDRVRSKAKAQQWACCGSLLLFLSSICSVRACLHSAYSSPFPYPSW